MTGSGVCATTTHFSESHSTGKDQCYPMSENPDMGHPISNYADLGHPPAYCSIFLRFPLLGPPREYSQENTLAL